VLGAPQVRSATLHLADGRRLRIRAEGFGRGHPFAARVRWNGRVWADKRIDHAQLVAGGELRFSMRAAPTGRGQRAQASPPQRLAQPPLMGNTWPTKQAAASLHR
jgi:putative alpha-1,2-mannosidase